MKPGGKHNQRQSQQFCYFLDGQCVTDQDPTPAVLPARVCMMIVGELSDVDRGQLPILFELVPGGR